MNSNDCPSSKCGFYTPDANDWTAAMDAEIENMHRFNVFKEVSRPSDTHIITRDGSFAANSRMGCSSSTRRN